MRKFLFLFTVILFSLQTTFAQDYALEYNGTDQRVKYTSDANMDNLNGVTDYTIELWVKPISGEINNKVVLKRFYQFAVTMYKDAERKLYFTHYGAPTKDGKDQATTFINTIDNVINIGEWNHIAIINNSTDNELKIYVNGADVTFEHYDAIPLYATPDDISATYHPNMYVGGVSGSYSNTQIDDVRILKVAKNISELQTTSVGGAEYSADGNTIILMKFNEGTGIVTADDANATATIEFNNDPTWVTVPAKVDRIGASLIELYPNPVTETATINLSEINNASELTIYDNMGRKVYSQSLNAGQNNVIINVTDLASGLYHININANNSIYTTKMSVVK